MNKLIRFVYYGIFIRFVINIILGLNCRGKDKLPVTGPAIIVSNHNSHLDTMVLMILMSKRGIPIPKPVAAADYFLSNPLMKWFALNVIGICPISRKKEEEDPLVPVYSALDNDEILIFFPEGSRGQPEKMGELKGGIAKLAERYPDVPIVPVFMHGLGQALPKGEALLVPFFCDVFVGDALYWGGSREGFLDDLKAKLNELSNQKQYPAWQ